MKRKIECKNTMTCRTKVIPKGSGVSDRGPDSDKGKGRDGQRRGAALGERIQRGWGTGGHEDEKGSYTPNSTQPPTPHSGHVHRRHACVLFVLMKGGYV